MLRLFPTVLAVMLACGAWHAQASYPDKPIRLVVGFGAGGPTDLPAVREFGLEQD